MMSSNQRRKYIGFGVLEYEESGSIEMSKSIPSPKSVEHCENKPCRILNCNQPCYKYRNVECVTMADLTLHEDETDRFNSDLEIHEEIFNIHTGFKIGAHWNGWKTAEPKIPLTLPNYSINECSSRTESYDDPCFYMQTWPENKKVRVLITNEENDSMYFGAHSIHMHGHHFRILAQGYHELDESGVVKSVSDHLRESSYEFYPQRGANVVTSFELKMDDILLNESGPMHGCHSEF